MSYSRTFLMSRTPREISALARLNDGPVETGHKQFDQAVNGASGYLGTGNVYSANQRSSYVRAFSKTFCNGRENAPGHLQDFDLKSFKLSAFVERAVRDEARDKDIILYEIQSSGGRGTTVHGYLITDTFHRELRSFTAQTPKAGKIMEVARSHLSWQDHDAMDPVPTQEITDLAADFTEEDFHALAEHLGYGSAGDQIGCRESGLVFNEEAPYSSWKDESPAQTMSRAASPGLAATLLCLRASVSPDDLREWVADRDSRKTADSIEP